MKQQTRKGAYWFLLRVAACCCCLACAACVIITGGYPEDWAHLERREAHCNQELTGVYAMMGVDMMNGFWFMQSETTPTRLDKYLMPSLGADADRIEIVGPSDGQLVITAEQGTTLIAQRTLKENTNYHCDKDGVFLRLKQDAGGYDKDVAAMAIGWKSERYSKAVDGSLIIRRTVRGGGVFMFLPLISSSEDWSRFPAVASPSGTAPSGATPNGLNPDSSNP